MTVYDMTQDTASIQDQINDLQDEICRMNGILTMLLLRMRP
jgi:hypothetical protein